SLGRQRLSKALQHAAMVELDPIAGLQTELDVDEIQGFGAQVVAEQRVRRDLVGCDAQHVGNGLPNLPEDFLVVRIHHRSFSGRGWTGRAHEFKSTLMSSRSNMY